MNNENKLKTTVYEPLKKVETMIEKIRATMPEVTNDMLDSDGAIFYMNSNDGTVFDWTTNHRLCEFFVFWKKSQVGFIKLMVHADGTVWGYIYEDGAISPQKTLDIVQLFSEREALEFAAVMNTYADEEACYNCDVAELNITNPDVQNCVNEFIRKQEKYSGN